ncbi:MAG TPA: hypothetical protein VLN45_03120 [Ignavibacteriaceae bacterium]|nr:hypothetical protein [Ignavibacteriaceae bacterium]
MKIFLASLFISTSLILSGCLTFHRISYEINLENDIKGNGTIRIYDIRSDADNEEGFDEDKNTLFDYIHKGENFLADMQNEGKDISSRRLYVKDDLLNGEVKFNFDDVRKVEGIAAEENFYYITMELSDSIYSTNGEVIFSEDYKRIVWDKSTKTLLFEMIATDYDDSFYRDLAPFYKEE